MLNQAAEMGMDLDFEPWDDDDPKWEEDAEPFDLSTTLAVRGRMLWVTQEGERMFISDMATTHLFNAMKMCFNHLAEAHGGVPVWFQQHWGGAAAIARFNPTRLAAYVVGMLTELDRRNDLPAKYVRPLEEIRAQIMPKRLEERCQ